jgi:hypothetical protein
MNETVLQPYPLFLAEITTDNTIRYGRIIYWRGVPNYPSYVTWAYPVRLTVVPRYVASMTGRPGTDLARGAYVCRASNRAGTTMAQGRSYAVQDDQWGTGRSQRPAHPIP